MRLLRLRPAGLRDDIPLECEIVYVDSFATHSYETVSWCSGREKQDQVLRIREGGQVYTLYISHNLKSALVALRRDDAVRQLWVDEVCIDWTSAIEHNYYVYRMSPIFGAADRLCIWLGASDVDSRLAIDFIKNKVMMNIKEFDTLIEDRSLFREWVAFIGLMKRPWFTRRWSVTELGLSPLTATLYCGKDSIEWMHFTDVVSLFVGAESATHRLSDVSKLDQPFDHIPDFIGDISSLGVAVLTDATANLFRNSANGVQEPLCSLEYLVSRFSMFDVIEPRDAIYSLVMISRDTTPSTLNEPYNVDYRLPVIDVYREFIEFSIYKSDKVNALDILCRPWAPPVFRSHDGPSLSTLAYGAGGEVHSEIPLPSWISCLVGGPFEMEEHPTAGLRMARQNVDPLVGLPGNHAGNYTAAGTKVLNLGKLEFIKWGVFEEGDAWSSNYSMFVEGFVLDEVSTVEQIASNGNIPLRWLGAGGWTDTNGHPPEELWRTLVADRGRSGLINPPNWFARALKVSVESQAKTTRGSLDTMKLIYEGRLASVTEFLRRVQEVVWNRRLIRTASGRLGLVREDVRPGYKVCILYGCTVPVILEEVVKSQKQMRSEHLYYYRQWLKERERIVALCQARFRMRRLRRDRAQEKESVNERPPEPTKISYSKCGQCRKDSQSCKPDNRKWPARCNRCLKYNYQCSPSRTRAEQAKLDIANPKQFTTVSAHNETQFNDQHINDNPEEFEQLSSQQQAQEVQSIYDSIGTAEFRRVEEEEFLQLSSQQQAQEFRSMYVSLKDRFRRRGKLEAEEREAKAFKDARPRSSSYYRLFGACYVHGIMNGEAIALQNSKRGSGQMEEQMFELR